MSEAGEGDVVIHETQVVDPVQAAALRTQPKAAPRRKAAVTTRKRAVRTARRRVAEPIKRVVARVRARRGKAEAAATP